jgi:hypothetical protein
MCRGGSRNSTQRNAGCASVFRLAGLEDSLQEHDGKVKQATMNQSEPSYVIDTDVIFRNADVTVGLET